MKSILPAAKSYLEKSSTIRKAFLVSLQLPGDNNSFVYLTDYHRDITYAGIPYIAGKLKNITAHKQTRALTVGNISLTLTGLDNTELLRLVQEGVSFLDRRITIHQAIIDDNGDVLPMDADTLGPLLYSRGKITSSGIKESIEAKGTSASTITWTCSNEFYDFEKVSGRFTDDASHRGLEVVNGALVPSSGAKRPEYQDDLGFFHANKSVAILAKYQVQELRYKLESKKKLFGLSKSYSLKSYYETVTKEVDMDINLTSKYLPVVYGVQKIPGIPVFFDTEKNNPNVVYAVYAFAEGEIDGFLDFYFGDAPMLCLDSNDSGDRTCFGTKRILGDTMNRIVTGQTTSTPSIHGQEYKYNDGNGDIRIWTFHGKSTQTAAQVLVDLAKDKKFYLQNLNNQGPEYWDERFKLLDTAYAVVRFTINENRTDIPEVSAELQGKKINVYQSNGSVVGNKTSLNGVWQTLDYLTSSIYGAGITIDQFNISKLVSEAALLDQLDTSYEAAWQPYWRYVGWENTNNSNRQIVQMNTIIDTAETVFKNTQELLGSYNGALNNLFGEYRLTIEKFSTTPLKLNILDTYGDIDLADSTGRNKYNSVQASILDPAMSWKNNPITFYNSKFKAEDMNVERKLQLAFSNITNYYTARSMADRELKKSRYCRDLKFSLPFHFIGIEPNDPIAFTYERYGWKDKYFLVDEVENTREGKISVSLREYSEGVFINSDQVDNSKNDVPVVTNNVLPPRDFKYTPTPGSTVGVVGKNGELSWLPSLTTNVVYYSIVASTSTSPMIIQQLNTTPDTRMTQDIIQSPSGLVVFEIRAVDVTGRRSSPVTLAVDLNSAKNISMVNNFRVLNLAKGDPNEFAGPDLLMAWDAVPEEEYIQGISYELEIYGNSTLIRTVTLSNKYTYDYLLINNKDDYSSMNSGKLGIYRNLKARIKAKGLLGEESVSWADI